MQDQEVLASVWTLVPRAVTTTDLWPWRSRPKAAVAVNSKIPQPKPQAAAVQPKRPPDDRQGAVPRRGCGPHSSPSFSLGPFPSWEVFSLSLKSQPVPSALFSSVQELSGAGRPVMGSLSGLSPTPFYCVADSHAEMKHRPKMFPEAYSKPLCSVSSSAFAVKGPSLFVL